MSSNDLNEQGPQNALKCVVFHARNIHQQRQHVETISLVLANANTMAMDASKRSIMPSTRHSVLAVEQHGVISPVMMTRNKALPIKFWNKTSSRIRPKQSNA